MLDAAKLPPVSAWVVACREHRAGQVHQEASTPTGGHASHAGPSLQLGRLHGVLAEALQELLRAVELAAMSDFNDWLVRPGFRVVRACIFLWKADVLTTSSQLMIPVQQPRHGLEEHVMAQHVSHASVAKRAVHTVA